MNLHNPLEVVIVGGGSAGWMTAVALSTKLPKQNYRITLVESEQIGTVGVGEATIPHIRMFNKLIGVDETDFIEATGATYKLGIQFEGWGGENSRYFHPFGGSGHDIQGMDFHHFWLKNRRKGVAFDTYSMAAQLAHSGKFQYPTSAPQELTSHYGYAFHLDAALYAKYLRSLAEQRGVHRMEGRIENVIRNSDSGDVEELRLDSGATVSGELFVDCSGFRSLLLRGAMAEPFEDWSKWLPCNAAYASPSPVMSRPSPFTRSIAGDFGWRWEIPLQHRTGNGYVFCDAFCSPEKARDSFVKAIDAEKDNPHLIKFNTGKVRNGWVNNCVGIGLASGFLEPLESTSLYLIQAGIIELLNCMPVDNNYHVERTEFNRALNLEYERVRDFLILHYKINGRKGSEFWDYCRSMSVPVSLQNKMDIFRHTGRVQTYRQGLFMEPSWLAVYFGQGYYPVRHDPRVEMVNDLEIEKYLDSLREKIRKSVETVASHKDFLASRVSSAHAPSPTASLYGEHYGK